MLTIEQLSAKTKDRIVEVLNQDGVSRDSVQACIMGVGIENLNLVGVKLSPGAFDDLVQVTRANNKEYATQVLTIYGQYIAKQLNDGFSEVFEISPETRAEIDQKTVNIIDETVQKFLSSVII